MRCDVEAKFDVSCCPQLYCRDRSNNYSVRCQSRFIGMFLTVRYTWTDVFYLLYGMVHPMIVRYGTIHTIPYLVPYHPIPYHLPSFAYPITVLLLYKRTILRILHLGRSVLNVARLFSNCFRMASCLW